jgi:phosphopantetheinyl transferase (holo-ACP synthase)
VILWQQQESRLLAEIRLDPVTTRTWLHPDEVAASGKLARPQPSLAVRLLAKELLLTALETLGMHPKPGALAILPFNAPPVLHMPEPLPEGHRIHLSLSHSNERVMALVILERLDDPAPVSET